MDDPVIKAKSSLVSVVYQFRLLHKKRAKQYLEPAYGYRPMSRLFCICKLPNDININININIA